MSESVPDYFPKLSWAKTLVGLQVGRPEPRVLYDGTPRLSSVEEVPSLVPRKVYGISVP